ncbi:L-2-haloalkanoic acid dehalogenase, HAD superfamily protein [Pseudooceanicola batsensis HTCC2597]|uniref:(S)-2-haloacid dehalogenase n=1 Tax=Pseudooceanicola batsensis (strain ATCC BAA-863 / DSM 15984 / KCTC 12145 / HTCC2597) TaxID=252305 RepID=A3TTK8_PSEBH|nr:haloacid dehalogenase type II [Pseudooceanicola batsensis]EAQ04985.1 L-2-haloalkanoic acid dehalogenase, HAD superfamily protein [Pseudooceanicola batsensis HTCC2597]
MPRIPHNATLAFDVYGTLIDPHALTGSLRDLVGDRAAEVSALWRQKQLEYSFRRGLMKRYVPFATVTAEALDYALTAAGPRVSDEARAGLLERYRTLDAFADARPALAALQGRGLACHAFSNGDPEDIESLLRSQDLWSAMAGAVSVQPVESFKPDPAVYAHFCDTTGAAPAACWLVSSNPFDVIGAMASGWQAVWVQRDPAVAFDPWGPQPTLTLASLQELPGCLAD